VNQLACLTAVFSFAFVVADLPRAVADKLYVATPVTQPKEFTGGIEGPATDREGNVYAVNFAEQGTIGRVSPDGKSELFVRLPQGSVGNGIRFDRQGMMYVADYAKHNVLKIDTQTRKVSVFANEPTMNQPNDLAIAPDGTLYASDPNWGKSTGQIWRVSTQGEITKVAADMGTTNGVEVSPDGKHLYVNESAQRNIWAFDIGDDGSLSKKRLLKQFPDHGFDGMRCDVKGNLYITRYGKGTVVIMTPEGDVLKEIDILGERPSNLCFGGPDGRTVYVTEVEHTRLVKFRVEHAGAAWQRWQTK
jgi:sugar lactone lactonase YvrE